MQCSSQRQLLRTCPEQTGARTQRCTRLCGLSIALQIWNTYTGEELFTLEGHKNVVSSKAGVPHKSSIPS